MSFWRVICRVATWATLLAPSVCLARELPPRSVLIINQSDPSVPFFVDYFSSFRETIKNGYAGPISLYQEHLDHNQFSGVSLDGIQSSFFREKYRDKPIDAIVASGSFALEFVSRHRAELWPGVPVVFWADVDTVHRLDIPPNVTGSVTGLKLQDMVVSARRLVPALKRIALVGDPIEQQPVFRHLLDEVLEVASDLEIVDLTGLPMAELRNRVATLPGDTAILYLGIRLDGAGVSYTPAEALSLVAEVANRPIVANVSTEIGHGATGGFVIDGSAFGIDTARQVLRIFNGESASNIPISTQGFTKWMFDWRQLQKWGVSEARLPPGSEIRFRPPNAWEPYREQIVGVAAVLALQTATIAWMLFEHRRRRTAEAVTRSTLIELAQSNRLATAGELTGTIAHEVKQPLAAMVTQAAAGLRWLTQATPDLDEVRGSFKKIIDYGRSATDVIDSVRAMFKKDDSKENRIPLDINELVRQVLLVMHGEVIKNEVSVQLDLDERLPEVMGDRVQLQQVIMNLARNALEAMSAVTDRARVLRIKTKIRKVGDVSVSIEDNGAGIDSKDIERIFNPLFTTKSQGMGLGLVICRSIIEAHHGSLRVLPGLNNGSIFQFRLPTAVPQSAYKRAIGVSPASSPVTG